VIIVLAIGHEDCGFKPDRVRCTLRAIKIRSTTSFGVEIKPAVPRRKIVWCVKNAYSMKGKIYKFLLFRYEVPLLVTAKVLWWVNWE
jgi:hypothetical protein